VSRRGRFITFEGSEGSGKTTQIERLVVRLEGEGVAVRVCREPGGTQTGEAIRDILQHDITGEAIAPEAEALLFAASRAQLVHTRILPALGEGTWVLCDRFADSTTAYQGYGRSFGVDRMQVLNEFAVNGAIPDQTFLIDVDPVEARARLASRNLSTGTGPDRIEREKEEFHARVRAGYLELAKAEPDRFVVIDGSDSPDIIEQRIWRFIEQDVVNR
jgi:dTMP kinase